MRILVLTNLYPPHFVGGYELQVREVVDGLRARGHFVHVLTSTYGIGAPEEGDALTRRLHFRWSPRPPVLDVLRPTPVELVDRAVVRRAVERHRPEIVLVGNLLGLARSLPECAAQHGARLAYEVSDYWFADFATGRAVFWNHAPGALLKRAAKELWRRAYELRGVPPSPGLPQPQHAYFRSRALKEHCLRLAMPIEGCPVIYCGFRTERFRVERRDYERSPAALLYAGRLHPNKGVTVLVEACQRLAATGARFTLALCGRGEPAFVRALRAQLDRAQLSGRARLLEGLPPEKMPALYAKHDVFVFPSTWEEPFGLTRFEAMAAGMPVATTLTGAGRETLRPGEDCLAFDPDDAGALADRLGRLIREPQTRARLGRQAQAMVCARFDVGPMVEGVEDWLKSLLPGSSAEVG